MEDYIIIELVLKHSQRKDFNKYKVTINGEERLVTYQICRFIVKNLIDIPNSFILDEVESFTITYKSKF